MKTKSLLQSIETRLPSLIALFCAASLHFAPFARGDNLATIYNFGGGLSPAGLAQGSDGNLYGAGAGGSAGLGKVFRLTLGGSLSIVHTFTGGLDSSNPVRFFPGTDGNFYGTTAGGIGTVFRVKTDGTFATIIQGFASSDPEKNPNGLVQGLDGNFYGITEGNGSDPGKSGTVFKLTLGGTLTTLHVFGGFFASDGGQPVAISAGIDGNLYGATDVGGRHGDAGTIFRITPNGNFDTIWGFSGIFGDGALPVSVVLGRDGIIYGVTLVGGAFPNGGTAFRVVPGAAEQVLHTFSGGLFVTNTFSLGGGGLDGLYPKTLIQGLDGNFYGTTAAMGTSTGGTDSLGQPIGGTVFRLTPDGIVTTLCRFPKQVAPATAAFQAGDGNLYGIASDGTVFKITPFSAPWANEDIGAPKMAGTSNVTNGVFTVKGAGADIYGSSDQFQFVWQPMTGDGQIIARVTGITNTNLWAKAGLMMRANLAVGSAHAMIWLSPHNAPAFSWRSLQDGNSDYTLAVSPVNGTGWLKLVRTGKIFRGYFSPDGNTWTLVGSASVPPPDTQGTFYPPIPATIFVGLAVSSQNANALNTSTFDHVSVSSLPAPWSDTDVGAPTVTGSATYNTDANIPSFTVEGSGYDIYGTADQFHFVWQPLNGNGQIVARVANVSPTNLWAKAGIMLRQNLTAGSPHAMMWASPYSGFVFSWRGAQNGSSNYTLGPLKPAGTGWLKLVRNGNTATGYVSADGVGWTLVGSTPLPAGPVYAGLAVSSQNPTVFNTSTFDQVTVTAQ